MVLALDVFLRGLHFRAFYTAEGFLPLKMYLVHYSLDQRRWSLLFANDTPLIIGALFGLYFLAAIALSLGYRTRLACLLCLVLFMSVYRRNPLANNGGDAYIQCLLLWGCFLPWGDAFSLGRERPLRVEEREYSALPGFCYLIQVAILYWFSAVLRVGPEWQIDFSALYGALHLESLNLPTAPYLLLLGSWALAVITFATIMLEVFGPILLLVPSQRVRILSVFLIIAFHFGILLTLRIPIFALACMAAPLGLLPARFWELGFANRLASGLEAGLGALRSRLPWSVSKSKVKARRFDALYPWLTLPLLGFILFYLSWGIDRQNERFFLSDVVREFSLDQRWGMFSPGPPREYGWQSARARTESGLEVNLLTGGSYSNSPDALINSTSIWDYRWRVFLQNPGMSKGPYPRVFLQYLVRDWDRVHPEDRVLVAQYVYHPRTIPNDFLLGETYERVLAEYSL